MAGETEYEAFDTYARPIGAALHCVTHSKLGYRFQPVLDVPQVLTFDARDPVPLRRKGLPRLHLGFIQRYRLIQVEEADDPRRPYGARIAEYIYSISDHRNVEILSFHWHPESPLSPRPEPHLHVKIKVAEGSDPSLAETFPKLHIPTEHVTIASVVRLLIEQFGVHPLKANWDAILTDPEQSKS